MLYMFKWLLFADALWNWGVFVFLLCLINLLTEVDCKINLEDYLQKREEDGI